MPRSKKKKTLGKGAVVSCKARFLHPSAEIRSRFPNMNDNKRLENLIVLRKDVRVLNNKPFECIFLQSDEVMNDDNHIELYVKSSKLVSVEVEGSSEFFFVEGCQQGQQQEIENEANPSFTEDIFNTINHRNSFPTATLYDEELANMLEGDVDIDNDNDPAPENDPDNIEATNQLTPDVVIQRGWGHSGVCYRRIENARDSKPVLEGINKNTSDLSQSLVNLFDILFPKQFVEDVILVKASQQTKLGPISYGEFLRFLGVFFLVGTIEGPDRRQFFASEDVNVFTGAPFRVRAFMSRNRFEDILYSLEYTLRDPPTTYNDRFFYVRDLIDAWNKNMHDCFLPGWVSCLDESMMEWTSQFTCPGFMFVPRKPHPFGNEWHSICCGISGIMYAVELVEGKDSPIGLTKEFHEMKQKTVALLLRLTKRLWHTGKVVVLDSGFCVLKGLIELRRRGVFAAAMIKKRRYWPRHVDGTMIQSYFEDKEVGHADSFGGELDNIPYHIYCMKDDGYVVMLMSTYGTNERKGAEKKRVVKKQRLNFKYPEVVANHYEYRHAVDDHNSKRHSPISFERVWGTKHWKDRVFAFLLSVTEVNVKLALKYFYNVDIQSMIEFRKLFAKALIGNEHWIRHEESLRRSDRLASISQHKLVMIPAGKKFLNGQLVSSKCKYALAKCSTCKSRVRTYCQCTPGVRLCNECYAKHVVADENLE
jgi:Transposase IS4